MKNKTKTMSNKILQQYEASDKEFEVKQKILKEIEGLDLEYTKSSFLFNMVISWKSQLKNLSKEEKPGKIEKIDKTVFDGMQALIDGFNNDVMDFLNRTNKQQLINKLKE